MEKSNLLSNIRNSHREGKAVRSKLIVKKANCIVVVIGPFTSKMLSSNRPHAISFHEDVNSSSTIYKEISTLIEPGMMCLRNDMHLEPRRIHWH